MKLYHGTAERAVAGILKRGIEPRGKRGGNWNHSIESNPECVYLTTAYPLHFAGNAVKNGERLAVVEVDTSKLYVMDLLPDEDFLEQATRRSDGEGLAPKNKSMHYRTRWYRQRAEQWQHLWSKSVEHMGTCCHSGTVPVRAITRVAYMDRQTYSKLVMHGCDPIISIENFRLCAAKYRNYTAWLFGDPLEPVDDGWAAWARQFPDHPLAKQQGEWSKYNIDRAGVSVHAAADLLTPA